MTSPSHAARTAASHLLRCGNSQDIHQLAGGVQVLLHGWVCQGMLQAPGSLRSRRALLCTWLLVSGSQWPCRVRGLCDTLAAVSQYFARALLLGSWLIRQGDSRSLDKVPSCTSAAHRQVAAGCALLCRPLTLISTLGHAPCLPPPGLSAFSLFCSAPLRYSSCRSSSCPCLYAGRCRQPC